MWLCNMDLTKSICTIVHMRIIQHFRGWSYMLYLGGRLPMMFSQVGCIYVDLCIHFLDFICRGSSGSHLWGYVVCCVNSVACWFVPDLMCIALCIVRRHAVWHLWYMEGRTPIWYHVGIWHLMDFDSFHGVKVRLYFFAAWSNIIIIWGTCFPSLLLHSNGCRIVRKVLISEGFVMPPGWIQFMIVSVMRAHVGCGLDRFRYNFTQVSSIALFCTLRSRRLMPPLLTGFVRLFKPRPSGVHCPSHRKSQIVCWSDLDVVFSIPYALVRNWVEPPTTICMMSCFVLRVGFDVAQRSSVVLILSRIWLHGVTRASQTVEEEEQRVLQSRT